MGDELPDKINHVQQAHRRHDRKPILADNICYIHQSRRASSFPSALAILFRSGRMPSTEHMVASSLMMSWFIVFTRLSKPCTITWIPFTWPMTLSRMYLMVRKIKKPAINAIAIGNPTSAIRVKASFTNLHL